MIIFTFSKILHEILPSLCTIKFDYSFANLSALLAGSILPTGREVLKVASGMSYFPTEMSSEVSDMVRVLILIH